MVKKGDTLIEVTLAVSIFSLVAIAVVAVVNGSTTGAQTALETTLAREEIDTQAEALRFIQSSYANGGVNEENNAYKALWEDITGTNTVATNISHDNPTSCGDIYNADDDIPTSIFNAENRSFIINTRKLGSSTAVSDIVVKSFAQNSANAKFVEASTYPRIIYTSSEIIDPDSEDEPDEETLLDDNTDNIIYHIEGIYVTAVPGPTTVIVKNGSTAPVVAEKAYHDFYIRTCWYGAGNSMPSTISTVIRLYNPAAFNV